MVGADDYRVFGLKIRSEIPLPELFEASDSAEPDVTIRRGIIQQARSDSEIERDGAALILTIPDIARYRIDNGRDILIDADSGIPDRNLRLFLLGSAFGALLHQRGMMPLHANAVEIDGRAFAFMGEPGAGKSTLAAWFHDGGFPIVADDVCVVRLDDDGIAYAYPGLPRLRLWQEALDSTGRESAHYERSYVGAAAQIEKFDVPIERSGAAASRLPLSAIYVLERGSDFSIERLTGVDAVEAIFANTYRGSYVAAASNQQGHWAMATELARNVPVYRFVRQWSLDRLNDQSRRLLEAMRTAGH